MKPRTRDGVCELTHTTEKSIAIVIARLPERQLNPVSDGDKLSGALYGRRHTVEQRHRRPLTGPFRHGHGRRAEDRERQARTQALTSGPMWVGTRLPTHHDGRG
jgi:hypothetical protein